jgi:hypothetical protein
MSDTVLGVIILAIFLPVVYVAGRWVNRFKNARFHQAWAPLVPLIDGKVVDDGGGAASSWMTGTYRGQKVQARMTPARAVDEDGPRFNDFSVAVAEVDGEHDWSFAFRSGPAPGKSPWRVTAGSTAVAQRLERAGIEARLPGLGYPKVTFTRASRLLEYQVDVTPSIVPTAEQFKATLEFLIWLNGINREANTSD